MRRINLGKKLVKKAIAWAMIAMMSMSTAMSSYSTLTVYAEESKVTEGEGGAEQEAEADTQASDNDTTQTDDAEEATPEIEVVEVTEKSEEVYSDGEIVTDNEDTQTDEVEEIIEDEVLDHVKVETTVNNVETHYVVTDTTGEAIVGTDAEGNTVEKIEVNAEAVEVKPVQVIEKAVNDKEVAVCEEVAADDILYGYFDESGSFVEGSEKDENSQGYTLTDGTYKETTTVNKVTQVNGSEVFVSDEVVDVLNGEEVDDYVKKTVYYVGEGENKQEIQEEDLEETLAGTNYSVDENGILSVEATSTINYIKDEVEKELDITGKAITDDQIKEQGDQYVVTIDGIDYTVDKEQVECDKEGKFSLNTTYSIMVDGNKKVVDEKNVETKTVYQVIDESGDPVCEVDATTKGNIETKHYTKVKDMYVVKNENNEDVYFTQQDWQVMTSPEVIYEEVTKYYYVSESKYESKELSFTAGDDKDYLLSVDFWNGDYVKLNTEKEITYVENENGDIVVTIPYLYTNDYEITENAQWTEGVYTKVISKTEFGLSRIATLTVKYTPTLSKNTKLTFEASVVEEMAEDNGNVKVTGKENTTVTGDLGNAAENVKNEVVTVKVFVRLDGEQQVENGTTHYNVKDYTEDLAAKYKKDIYIAYSKEGYAVHDNNLGDLTAEEKIQTKLAGSTYEENLKELANLYMLHEKQEQVKEYTGSEEFAKNITEQILAGQEEAKKANVELNGENGTIEWTYIVGDQKATSIEEAIELAKTMTVALTQKDGLGVDWYVLKDEDDGWHIDGVSKVPSLEISMEGRFVPNAQPSATPEETPSASPSEAPEETPSASPSEAPEATPESTPAPTPGTPDEPEDDPVDPDDQGEDPVDDTPFATIEDEPVALVAAPEVEDVQAEVLGARRVSEPTTEAAVLGARRGTDYAVLGKRRRPETGDSVAMAAWAAALGLGLGAAAISGSRLRKDRKKTNSPIK